MATVKVSDASFKADVIESETIRLKLLRSILMMTQKHLQNFTCAVFQH